MHDSGQGRSQRLAYIAIKGDGFISFVIAGLDPAIHAAWTLGTLHLSMDARVIGERSDAVLRTAMPAHDERRGQPNAARTKPPDRRPAAVGLADAHGADRRHREGRHLPAHAD